MQLLLATRNAHKTREFRELLGNEFRISDLSGRTDSLIEETGRTFAENAALKAVTVSQTNHGLIAADDSGLEVDSLNGAPGIFSARYAGAQASDQANVAKLLGALAGMADRRARFRCVIALAQGGRLLRTFEGTIEGVIAERPEGTNGFGYDPVFVPDRYHQTFAEVPAELKNRISHRAKAVEVLRDYLLDGCCHGAMSP